MCAGCVLIELSSIRLLPRWCGGKGSICRRRGHKRHGFDPWVGKIPWSRKWQFDPVFLPGKSHGQRSLVSLQCTHTHTLCMCAKSQTQLSTHTHSQPAGYSWLTSGKVMWLRKIRNNCTIKVVSSWVFTAWFYSAFPDAWKFLEKTKILYFPSLEETNYVYPF